MCRLSFQEPESLAQRMEVGRMGAIVAGYSQAAPESKAREGPNKSLLIIPA
jgi:hypothetical protein